ncbi:Ig-like domain-containing protein [Treponema berlinense]|uniref:Ig-like domain-containing protein n=1 Tax=Treponema berlinense TaxID=225004 RepID=UPI003FD855E2
MKKMLRIAAVFAALLAMTNFIGCKNDDDEESGNGLENTYWAMEDISIGVVENVSLTLKNGVYVHIEDSSKGSVYAADVESLDYSTLDLTKTNSVDISYSSKESFTYVVDGSKITVTSKYTDDAGKEQTTTFEGTLAADKKSFTIIERDEGKEVSVTYTRIDKAPAKATLVITVTDSDVAVTEVKITSTLTDVTAGENITLTAKVLPDNATDKTVTWTSSNPEVATVKDGVVTGIKEGKVTITAKAGEKTATVDVTVKAATTSGGETATPKTATIAYDGSSAENAPTATGDEGVFSSVEEASADAGVVEGYSFDVGYPKWGSQTYTGDNGVSKGTTSTGSLIQSSLLDGNTKIDFAAGAVIAYVTYNFTLSAKSDVDAAVKAFNTQSSALAGKIEILDSTGNSKVSKQAEKGSKSANDVTADPVELDAGEYTFKFSWVLTKAAQLKKITCGISSFSIKATTK